MSEQRPDISGTTLRLPGNSRRSTLNVLKWLTMLALLCFLIAVASGLIPAGVSPSSTVSSVTAEAPAGPTPNGWGAEKSYLGRYRLLGATQQVNNGAPATSLAGGELTLFMREEHKNAPLVPSGVLELHGPAPIGIELLYMTSLTHGGSVRHAVINGGSFAGPVVGSLTGVTGGGGDLTVTATVQGLGTLHARFVRFSASPQP